MRFIEGGSLVDKICSSEHHALTEKQTAEYMKDLFSAVAYCHAQGIIHRDIKPENILITKTNQIKLIDFGLSRVRVSKTVENEIVGTGYYMAPEVVRKADYNEKADCWSLGVVLYLLVSGNLPFIGSEQDEVFAHSCKGEVCFDLKAFDCVSEPCKDLISKLLVVDQSKRLPAAEAMKHPWF